MLNRANVLSPYGVERKRPAGERMCRQAVVKASWRLRTSVDGTRVWMRW